MKNNTIVTAGDTNYLWGLFLLIASMRKAGMDEPVLVGTSRFDDRSRRILSALGDVSYHSLDHARRSLTCYKAEAMLAAKTDFVTWADSDGFFTGNVSDILAPKDEKHIHVRRRSKAEMPGAFPAPYDLKEILPRWRTDVAEVLKNSEVPKGPSVGDFCSCSACFLSLARGREDFLRLWHELMMRLPLGDAGVVDRSLRYYHQLDESCLNAALTFMPEAPVVTERYEMDKDQARLFVHFVGRPKPWIGWIPSSIRRFDATLDVIEWAIKEKLELPEKLPYAFVRSHKPFCRASARFTELYWKIKCRCSR